MIAVLIFSGQASVQYQKRSDPFVILPNTKNKELNNSKKHSEQTHFPVLSVLRWPTGASTEVHLTGSRLKEGFQDISEMVIQSNYTIWEAD